MSQAEAKTKYDVEVYEKTSADSSSGEEEDGDDAEGESSEEESQDSEVEEETVAAAAAAASAAARSPAPPVPGAAPAEAGMRQRRPVPGSASSSSAPSLGVPSSSNEYITGTSAASASSSGKPKPKVEGSSDEEDVNDDKDYEARSRKMLSQMPVSRLRHMMKTMGASTVGCIEKADFVERLIAVAREKAQRQLRAEKAENPEEVYKEKAPEGYEEVTEDEYWRRVKKIERQANFLGIGTCGFFCFTYVIIMGTVFSLLYFSIYMRDPRFFDPLHKQGFSLLVK
eukprot:TRINITY_DN15765_c0_g1_i1.p1 TRINITY_DN15765_c0_g1~~TRINITY_DN15765_c0_g1_i1.p1  ORF type:complete len:284 (+),score=90.97 TRINITY_DN15765_c0_g1_i1:90-941(+)